MHTPTALIILDGFGISSEKKYNAIAQAYTPNITQWLTIYPHSAGLKASGQYVGLPKGFQGNSQVGHLTIGAGRIVAQTITRWQNAINNGSFAHNTQLIACLEVLKKNNGTLHIMGLLSNAGIHSHTEQLYACINAALKASIKKIVIHPFLDGRDSPPQSAYNYMQQLENYFMNHSNIIIGSIQGRFYSMMDRDNNWERTAKSYRILTEQNSLLAKQWKNVLTDNYQQGITDEFIPPTALQPDCSIVSGDGIIFFNTRPDRARQLTACFVDQHHTQCPVKRLSLSFFITPIDYGNQLRTIPLLKKQSISNTLKEVLAYNGKTIFSVAETEKYAHITYFFSGEKETCPPEETCILVPSLHCQTYSKSPEMSAAKITTTVIQSLQTAPKDFYLINYANADMVGHSGDFNATVKAVEFLDKQLKILYDQIISTMNGTIYITADHGKAETMYNTLTKQPHTSHTCNTVPFIMINQQYKDKPHIVPITQLSEIAPFILNNMGIAVPREMRIAHGIYSKKT